MSRLDIMSPSLAQAVVVQFYRNVEHRIAFRPSEPVSHRHGKDNAFPVDCAYICEHLCKACCRRMADDAVNIRAMKRYAVGKAEDVPQPVCAPTMGKKGGHRRQSAHP